MVSMTLLVALGAWSLVAPGAALIHDYWTYPLLAPVFLGLAAGLQRLRDHVASERTTIGVYVVLLVLAATGLARLPDYRDAYFLAPSEAGALIRDVPPAPGQATAWVFEGVDPLPRWVSYYWDLPTEEVNSGSIERIGDGDVVLVRLDQTPEWVQAGLQVEAHKGRYALATGHALRSDR